MLPLLSSVTVNLPGLATSVLGAKAYSVETTVTLLDVVDATLIVFVVLEVELVEPPHAVTVMLARMVMVMANLDFISIHYTLPSPGKLRLYKCIVLPSE